MKRVVQVFRIGLNACFFFFVFLPIHSLQVLLLKRKRSSHGSCLALGLDVVYSKVQMDCVIEMERVSLLQDENV